jgi:chemotaxis protein CheX
MDNKYIDPINQATLEVLSTMANLDARLGTPSIKKDAKAIGDITGVMSLIGDKAKGSIAITFTKPVASDIMRRMLGTEINEIDEIAMDLTGEIANMVAGVTIRLLEGKGYNFSISLPTVIAGKDQVVIHKFDGLKTVLPFSTDSGNFFVEFCFSDQ